MVESWQRQLIATEGYLELGMFDEARALLRALPVEDCQRMEVLQMQCALLLQTANWAEAVDLARRLTDADPGDVQNWIHWAYASRRCASINEAETILIDALKHHPEEWCIYYNLACYGSVQGQLEAAQEFLERALKLQPACREMAREDPDLRALWRALAAREP